MIKRNKIQHDICRLLPAGVEYLRNRKQILAAYLFGSYARNEEAALSDLDIAVLLKHDLIKPQLWALEDQIFLDLSEIFRTDEIDLVILNLAPLRIQFEIITTGQLLCSNDDGRLAEFESYALRRYWDFKKYIKEYEQHFIKRLKEGLNEAQRREYQNTIGKVREVHRRVKETAATRTRSV